MFEIPSFHVIYQCDNNYYYFAYTIEGVKTNLWRLVTEEFNVSYHINMKLSMLYNFCIYCDLKNYISSISRKILWEIFMMIYTEHVLNHEYYISMIISKVLTKLLIIGITLVNMHKSLEYTTLTNMRPVFLYLK